MVSRSFADMLQILFRRDSFYRAYIGTGPTINASVRIDPVYIAFVNCFRRAFTYTCATCSTIVANFISHNNDIYE